MSDWEAIAVKIGGMPSRRATTLLTSLLVGFWPSRFDARAHDDELAELCELGFAQVSLGSRRGIVVAATVEGQRFMIEEKRRAR